MPSPMTLLLKCTGIAAAPGGLHDGFKALALQCGIAFGEISVNAAVGGGEYYAYLELPEPDRLGAPDMARIAGEALKIPALAGLAFAASRLEQVTDIAGVSQGEAAAFHYCVEIDPAPGWETEIPDWYDTEHMPGLAKAPGCSRARRLLNLDASPRMVHCYDLASPAVRETKQWLDVVATPWASRVRPNFRNTKRTMFRRIPPA